MKTLPIALGLSAVFAVSACGGGSGTSSPPPSASPAALANTAAGKAIATTQIKAHWATFFNSATPQPTAVSLLENGANLGPAIAFAAHLAKTEKLAESAVVTKVVFTDPTHAKVTYNLLGNGKPLLNGSNGEAVYVDGTWKVAQETFCTLVDLGAAGKKVPGC
jgi:hypothetical protein